MILDDKKIEAAARRYSEVTDCDKEFETKFKQLLNETKQRLQKEFDEL